MSDSENETIVIQHGESLEPAAQGVVVIAPKSAKLAQDDGEEEESSDGEDTPSDEEGEETLEGMEREAKKLFLGKENGEDEEHEWVDRVNTPFSIDKPRSKQMSSRCPWQ
jgi:hypothetical protein